ncbi:MAG: Hint domain-containing protein [Pseudomonadota bacterium]
MNPSLSEIKYLGLSPDDFVEIRIPDGYPDPENLVMVIYDRSHNGSTTNTPAARDIYNVTADGNSTLDTTADGFTHFVIGDAYSGDAIALHRSDAIGLYNKVTGETYGLFSFGNPYTVSTAALQANGTPDPFAGQATTVLTVANVQGESLQEQEDGSYLVDATPTPGSSYICFCEDTRILTTKGEVVIQNLQAGDWVVTKDHGPQPIRWIGHRDFNLNRVDATKLVPVCVAKNSFAPNVPSRDLWLSPNHHVKLKSAFSQLLFAKQEVLVPVKSLFEHKGIAPTERRAFSYYHILLDQHELIRANNAWSESLFLGDQSVQMINPEYREEIFAIFPELRGDLSQFGKFARPALRLFEARLLPSN